MGLLVMSASENSNEDPSQYCVVGHVSLLFRRYRPVHAQDFEAIGKALSTQLAARQFDHLRPSLTLRSLPDLRV
jgi:hypothetical protein